jgi:hypothetical protein
MEGGKLWLYNGTQLEDIGSYNTTSAKSFRIIADPVTDKFDLYIDGNLTIEQNGFMNGATVDSIDAFKVYTMKLGVGFDAYIDHLNIFN